MRVLPIDPLERVTGSCYLVDIPELNHRLLVDCGAYQDGPDADVMDDRPFPFEVSSIDTVVLTHAHFDHCGRLARLAADGFAGQVIATEETIEIARASLEHELRRSKKSRELAALGGIRWRGIGDALFVRPMSIATDVFLKAHRSAHIVGAISAEIIVGPKERPGDQLRVIFSGDLGNNLDGHEVQPFLRSVMNPTETAHLAFMESTYGSKRRPAEAFDPEVRRTKLRDEIAAGIARGGPAILPVLGIQRAQDVLWDLHLILARDPAAFAGAPLLLDAPSALRMHKVLREALGRDTVTNNSKVRPAWLGKHMLREMGLDGSNPSDLREARAAIDRVFCDAGAEQQDPALDDDPAGPLVGRIWCRWTMVPHWERAPLVERGGPVIVLATSGMAEGGPVIDWLRRWLSESQASVLFTSYCKRESVGGRLCEIAGLPAAELARLQKPLELPDSSLRSCDVKARVFVMSGYSAHADQDRLIEWAFPKTKDGVRIPVARTLCVTHGEQTSRRALEDALKTMAARLAFDLRVVLPRPDGHAIDVKTGDPVGRDEALGVATSKSLEPPDVEEMRLEIARLREENARLRRDGA